MSSVGRAFAARIVAGTAALLAIARAAMQQGIDAAIVRIRDGVHRHHGVEGLMARTWSTGGMVLWVALMLAGYLLVYYL